MNLQYVFGNPTGTKKKKRGKSMVKKKKTKKNPVRKRAKAYEPVKKKTKSGKTVTKRGKKAAQHTTAKVATRGELHANRAKLSLLRKQIADLRDMRKQAKGNKKVKDQLLRSIKAIESKYKKLNADHNKKRKVRKTELNALDGMIQDFKKLGAIVDIERDYTGDAKLSKAKKKTKKKASRRKKKTTKKAGSRRKKKTTKKKASKKKTSSKKRRTKKKTTRKKAASRRKTTKKRSTSRKKTTSKKRRSTKRRRPVALKKGQSVLVKANPKKRKMKKRKNPIGGVIMKKHNPMKVGGMQVAGYEPIELAELATGGLIYGAANSYLTPMFAKIPGLGQMAGLLGGTAPCLITGVLLNIASDKIGNAQAKMALNFVGDGLLGAAIVGAGVHLSQTILPAPMSGVDFVPASAGQDPDFGGVDFTPHMAGKHQQLGAVDFTPGGNLPGENMNADFGKFDFAYAQDAADFGQIPQGLG
jgi:hypothetical protein